jgi:hypothetical protein
MFYININQHASLEVGMTKLALRENGDEMLRCAGFRAFSLSRADVNLPSLLNPKVLHPWAMIYLCGNTQCSP